MSPILAEAERSQLLKALQTFTKAMSSRCGIESATAQGLAAAEAEAHAQRLVAQNADAPLEVEIYVYLEVFDTYIKQKGSVKNGTYSFLLDSALCSLLNFPTSSWSVYDRFRGEFVPIPTFCALKIVKNEFLVIRPTNFGEEDCIGLDGLIRKLNAYNLPKAEYPGQAIRNRKRGRADDNAVAGPSKRRKPAPVEYLEISDSDSE
ncbi:hypothetical protein GALMADRAFT_147240 [Galerina marginata CBS 339.88]|uniref:Uncharacterized protein n=1 Tax=Galerina marginata (strain CBS 339.88) TaxID=685588 RepID=A0A067SB92_GALM3|nr:hypothetical protein GALMADRAFT_147240 [Galerina marginata CBS 339.88]